MRKINYLLILTTVALSGIFIASCKKEKTEVNLIVKNWNLVSKTVAGLNVATNCETNSKWNFKSGGTYEITDTCNNTKTGTWKLAEDGKTLTVDDNTIYSVIENSLSKLVIELQVNGVGLVRWNFN